MHVGEPGVECPFVCWPQRHGAQTLDTPPHNQAGPDPPQRICGRFAGVGWAALTETGLGF